MMGNGTLATTKDHRHLMNSRQIKYDERGGDTEIGVRTSLTDTMPQVHAQAE